MAVMTKRRKEEQQGIIVRIVKRKRKKKRPNGWLVMVVARYESHLTKQSLIVVNSSFLSYPILSTQSPPFLSTRGCCCCCCYYCYYHYCDGSKTFLYFYQIDDCYHSGVDCLLRWIWIVCRNNGTVAWTDGTLTGGWCDTVDDAVSYQEQNDDTSQQQWYHLSNNPIISLLHSFIHHSPPSPFPPPLPFLPHTSLLSYLTPTTELLAHHPKKSTQNPLHLLAPKELGVVGLARKIAG